MNKKLLYLSSYINVLFLNYWHSAFIQKGNKFSGNILLPQYLGRIYVNYPILYKIFSFLFFCLFPFLFFLYVNYKLFYYIVGYILAEPNKKPIKRLFFYNSKHILFTSRRIGLFTHTDIMLVFPGNKNPGIDKHQIIYIYDIIKLKNIISTYFLSLSIFCAVINKNGYRNSFYVLNAFDWFLLAHGLENMNPNIEIFMSNQKDRWAYLIDKSPIKKKNIIQHGTNFVKSLPSSNFKKYTFYDTDNYGYILNMPLKLSRINKLYSFSNCEAKYMLIGEIKNKPDIEIIGYNIYLTELSENIPTILIVGFYTNYADYEEFLISYYQRYNIRVYLKSHPNVNIRKYDRLKSKYNFVLVNSNFYPKVDLVFSYSSTLALEYQNCGIPVVYYNDIIDLSTNNISETLMSRVNLSLNLETYPK